MGANGHSESTSLVHNSKTDEENMRKLKAYQPWVCSVGVDGFGSFVSHIDGYYYERIAVANHQKL